MQNTLKLATPASCFIAVITARIKTLGENVSLEHQLLCSC